MTIVKTLLVGMFSHPPATILLQNIPGGASLRLVPEPENPYDSGAIKVYVSTEAIPGSRYNELEMLLPGCGMTLHELISESEWMLGHVAANGGKPLAKAGLTQGNKEIGQMIESGLDVKARLFFWPDGKPGIEVSTGAYLEAPK